MIICKIVCVLCDRDHLVGVSSAKPRPSSEVLGISKREAVMVSAVECVRSVERERRERRKENRAELVKQLEEAELAERKEKSKASVFVHTLYMYGGIIMCDHRITYLLHCMCVGSTRCFVSVVRSGG